MTQRGRGEEVVRKRRVRRKEGVTQGESGEEVVREESEAQKESGVSDR